MPEIKPSAAITVKTDTSIEEVILKMNQQKVGSVIVLGATYPHAVEGIFTERDVLKNISLIQRGDHWRKAIITVMQKPVVKINILELDKAADLMLSKGFRHLPVIYYDEKHVEHLAGVISMRDLFRYYVETSYSQTKPTSKKKTASLNIGVITKDETTFGIVEAILKQEDRVATSKVEIKALHDYLDDVRPFPKMSVLIFDLDWIPSSKWSRFVKSFIDKEGSPYMIAIYEPTMHKKADIEFMKKFEKVKRFAAFAKPISIMDMLRQIKLWI